MAESSEQTVPCPSCGAPNFAGAAICGRCGAPLVPAAQQLPPARPQPVSLRIPILRGPTFVTWGLLAINVIVWLAMTVAGGSESADVLLRFGAKYGPSILAGEYWRLFTAMFLHIGIIHLGFNCYALYILGPETERLFGRERFLTAYLLSGVASIAVSYVFGSTLSAGASGAIFGLVGTLAAFFYRSRKLFGSLGRRRLNNLISIVAINLVIGLTVPNIDNWAHMGGLVAGLLIGWVLSPEYEVIPPDPFAMQPAEVVDRNSLARRWWVIPATLAVVALLALAGNLREDRGVAGRMSQASRYMVAGDWDAASEQYTAALEREPELWSAYLFRAEAYLQMDRYADAMRDFSAVHQGSTDKDERVSALTGRGRVYIFQGELAMALQAFDDALLLDEQDAYAHLVRGFTFLDLGQRDQASEDLRRALALADGDEEWLEMAREALASLED